MPQVDSVGVGYKGPSPRELRPASLAANSGHKYPQYHIDECQVFQHRLPRMITVMHDRLQVSIEKRNGSRVRTISLRETDSRLGSSLAATTPHAVPDSMASDRKPASSLQLKSNLREKNKSNLTCLANQQISEFPEI